MTEDAGQDKTDRAEDARLAEQAVRESNFMPFFRVDVDPIPMSNLPPKKERS
jgi:hypothetical protein